MSCENDQRSKEVEVDQELLQKELVSVFFNEVQNWSKQNIQTIDSLGNEIMEVDTTIDFLPYENDYENKSFVFVSKDRNSLKLFEESEYLMNHNPKGDSIYKVWRKKTNQRQVLDLSIEPHPVLKWMFVARLRGQE